MNTYKRKDGKVTAELLVDNGETAIYTARWTDRNNKTHENFTACTSARFNREFVNG